MDDDERRAHRAFSHETNEERDGMTAVSTPGNLHHRKLDFQEQTTLRLRCCLRCR